MGRAENDHYAARGRATEQSNIGGTDIAETIARLQELSLVLEASQASFAKLAQLTLFNQV